MTWRRCQAFLITAITSGTGESSHRRECSRSSFKKLFKLSGKYGTKEIYNTRYVLSSVNLNYKIIKEFACAVRPMELNILLGNKGQNFFLYDTSIEQEHGKNISETDLTYFYRGLIWESEFKITKRFIKHLFKSHKIKNIKAFLKKFLKKK